MTVDLLCDGIALVLFATFLGYSRRARKLLWSALRHPCTPTYEHELQ